MRRLDHPTLGRPDKSLPGLGAGDVSPLEVFIKPVVRLSEHLAVFYRLNHFSLGPGWPKWTEHAVGVRFFPQLGLVLRAEMLLTHLSETSTEAAGFRLSGSFRF